jgi:nucleoside-diphosphate-sugar epimerase
MKGRGVVGNALEPDRMKALIAEARPEVVVHLLTALPAAGVLRKGQLRPTNELRTRGTANLIGAAIEARARRIVAESFVGVYGPQSSSAPISEDGPLVPVGGGPFTDAVLALRSMEDQLLLAHQKHAIETVALRIGLLYGAEVPSTQLMIKQARNGRLLVPRGLSGIGPFVHNEDAVAAVVAAVEQKQVSRLYNVADDEPLSLTEFLSRLTTAVSAPPPRKIPAWLVRLAAPVIAELGSARLPLANAKAKRELGWSLRYPTTREGLAELQGMATLAA